VKDAGRVRGMVIGGMVGCCMSVRAGRCLAIALRCQDFFELANVCVDGRFRSLT